MAELPCNNCGSSDAVEDYADGDFCFSCHTKINRRLKLESGEVKQKDPKKINLVPITDFWVNWLKARGLHEKTVRNFDIQFDELSQSIAYPIKVEGRIVGYQLRDENKKIKTVRYAKDTEPFLFEADANYSTTSVLVEDPVSAMRIYQDAGMNAIAILGTNLTAINKMHLFNRFEKFIVWLDGDLAGYKAAQKIRNDIEQFRETQLIYTNSDPKDMKATDIRVLFGKVLGIIK